MNIYFTLTEQHWSFHILVTEKNMPNILPNMLQCWSWIFMFSHDLLKLFTSSFPTKHEFQLHISMSELWILLTNTNPAKQENNEEIPKKHVFPSFFALLQSYNSLLQRGLTSLLPAIGHKAEHPPPPAHSLLFTTKPPVPFSESSEAEVEWTLPPHIRSARGLSLIQKNQCQAPVKAAL